MYICLSVDFFQDYFVVIAPFLEKVRKYNSVLIAAKKGADLIKYYVFYFQIWFSN